MRFGNHRFDTREVIQSRRLTAEENPVDKLWIILLALDEQSYVLSILAASLIAAVDRPNIKLTLLPRPMRIYRPIRYWIIGGNERPLGTLVNDPSAPPLKED